jgi:uncharacterized membrane protein YedE/YeeE
VTDIVVLGLLIGAALGALMARGGVCFNAALRRAAFERDARVLRVFAIAVAVQLLALPALSLLGVGLTRVGLFPAAQVVGGLVFGAGMALAGGCVTGILWKAGAGSIATGVAVAGFAAGELLSRGPWREALSRLDGAVAAPSAATLHGALGVPYEPLAAVAGVVALFLLLRRRRRAGLGLGLALGGLSALAWAAADRVGAGYGLGFTGTAANVRTSLVAADPSLLGWSAFLALGVVGGAALAIRGPVRRPDAPRLVRALAGGVLMGAGASMAHGCNIGLGLAGIPTLSLGSMLAVACMAVGAVCVRGLLLEPSPALRGVERPSAAGW